MKCPVCAWEHPSLLCPRCGFDSSRNYEKHPTFGMIGKVPAASALRKEWEAKQRPKELEKLAEPENPIVVVPEETEKTAPQKKSIWIVAAICAVVALGVWIGVGMRGKMPAKPGETQSGQIASVSSKWHSNYLLKDNPESKYVYSTNILRSSVKTITFLDTLKEAPEDAIDVTANLTKYADSPESVKLWTIKKGDYCDLFFAADGGINAQFACNRMFEGYTDLTKINFGDSFHTDHVRNMSLMFAGCISLKDLDLSAFNTSNVEDMSSMFLACLNLKSLDLSGFDTSNVQLMTSMFQGCANLTKVDLSTFDTSNASTTNMFDQCPAGSDWQRLLTNAAEKPVWAANVLKQDTFGSVRVYDTDIFRNEVASVEFRGTLSIAPEDAIDVSAQGDGSVKMWAVPEGELYKLYFAAEGGINAKDACYGLFSGFYNLKEVSFGRNFHTDQTENMSHMFARCSSLANLDLGSFNTAKVRNMSHMFEACSALTDLALHNFDMRSTPNMDYMFHLCPAGDLWLEILTQELPH